MPRDGFALGGSENVFEAWCFGLHAHTQMTTILSCANISQIDKTGNGAIVMGAIEIFVYFVCCSQDKILIQHKLL